VVNDAVVKTLADAADFLRARNIPFAVIGGFATLVRGEPRTTQDVDFVLEIDVPRCLQLLDELGGTAFQPLFPEVAEVVEKAFLLPLRHTQTQTKVDLAVGMTGFEQAAIRRATSESIGGHQVPVVTAEDLILMKTLASRPRDVEDVSKIVTRQQGKLDWDYLLSTAAQLQETLDQDILTPVQQLRGSSDAT
jgi:predicted nucleotidyltransferase